MIKTCIFDLDGVIVDTAKYHYLAWRRLAGELGFEFSGEQNEELKGISRMASLDKLLAAGGMEGRFDAEQKTAMASRKNEWYVEYIMAMGPDEILPGAAEFLREVRAAGMKTALGSASRNAGTILDRVGIRQLFDAVVDGNMVTEAKPDPRLFLLGAELTATPPAKCVVFEDAEAGIEAARRAGMRSVGVGGSPKLSEADARIDSFGGFTLRQLETLLKQNNR